MIPDKKKIQREIKPKHHNAKETLEDPNLS